MKRRASLLFGLGVLVSLSMSVPTYAATDNTQSIPQTQEAQQNEEGTETSSYKISEKTENGQWQLQKQDGKVVTGQNGFYIIGSVINDTVLCQIAAFFNLREQRAKVRACTRPWRLPR